jgi:hypothetical protein
MKIERLRLSATNRPIEVIRYWHDEGHLELSPPYQRGDVWGQIRQRNLIRSILLGVPIPSIIINDRFSPSYNSDKESWGLEKSDCIAVIDGKQRMTAILAFLQDDLTVPGEWFGLVGEITYSMLPMPQQRGFKHYPIQFCEGQLRNLEEEREVFELVNFGGVPQGETDLPNELA